MKHFLIILFSCLNLTLFGQPSYYYFSSNVYFKSNSIDVVEDSNYKEFEESLKFLKENREKITRVYISGSTSPDGDIWENVALCNKRVWKISDIFLQYISANKIYVLSQGEDYGLLYNLIEESDDPDKTLILNILSIHRNPKYHLQQHPTIWKRLEKQYFPLLRRVHIDMYVEYPG